MRESIRYVLFEDEYYTQLNLKSMITAFRPNYQLVGQGESVEKATSILRDVSHDLVIASMQLSDGCCLDAFRRSHSGKPVILIAESKTKKSLRTLNVVDYILKPVSVESIRESIERFEKGIS